MKNRNTYLIGFIALCGVLWIIHKLASRMFCLEK